VVTELVDEADVANALSLNTAVMTGSRVFGPALAGFLVASIGTGWCFAINAASFVAVLGGLLLMDPTELRVAPRAPRGGRPLRDSIAFVAGDPLLRPMFVALLVVSTFAFNYNVALPLLVKRSFGGGATAVGWLLAVTSVGSVIGSLTVASRRVVGAGAFAAAMVVLGVAATALGAVPGLAGAYAVAVPMGIGGAAFLAASNGIMQPRTPPHMRGRLLALQATAFLGSTVIGGPVTGWVGDHLGSGWSVSYGGLVTLATVAWFVRHTRRTRALGPAAPVATPA
jgi:MFS family permease